MTRTRAAALVVWCSAAIAGSVADHGTFEAQRSARHARRGTSPLVLEADFHVHAFPGDGLLPRWELQREAVRRGLDAIAMTNHNQTFAPDLLRAIDGADVLTLRGEEITSVGYHLIAAGIQRTIDWRATVSQAAAAIHAQGGVAIAAHPLENSFRARDPATLAALDGVEAAHPVVYFTPNARHELAAFHDAVRAVNPGVAPIGSSDMHGQTGMGDCRTFLVVEERSATGVLEAIRRGHTVASDRPGSFIGDPALVRLVQDHVAQAPRIRPPYRLHRAAALAVLLALACLVIFR